MMFSQFFGREPWQAVGLLQDEMNRLFGDFFTVPGKSVQFPLVNLWGTENDVMVQAELCGVNPAEVELNVHEDVLTIQGLRKPPQEAEAEGTVYHRQERIMGDFKRTVKLPFRVDADKVEAKYDKGILRIKLPRAEKDKPRQIKVQGV